MLQIKELHVEVEGKSILKGFNLNVKKGEIHVLMGPNGAGKSTLARVIAGDPAYEVTSGQILFEMHDLLQLSPEERAVLGIFMGFQYPVEIPGMTNAQFLLAASNAKRKFQGLASLTEEMFAPILEEHMALVGVKLGLRERNLNEGFSGGEKKRNEILQMSILDPMFAILDETDSGLDIDAMKIVAQGVNRWMTPEKSLLLITHYQRLLDHIHPHFVHVVVDGAIVQSGGPEVALELEAKGYEGRIS